MKHSFEMSATCTHFLATPKTFDPLLCPLLNCCKILWNVQFPEKIHNHPVEGHQKFLGGGRLV